MATTRAILSDQNFNSKIHKLEILLNLGPMKFTNETTKVLWIIFEEYSKEKCYMKPGERQINTDFQKRKMNS